MLANEKVNKTMKFHKIQHFGPHFHVGSSSALAVQRKRFDAIDFLRKTHFFDFRENFVVATTSTPVLFAPILNFCRGLVVSIHFTKFENRAIRMNLLSCIRLQIPASWSWSLTDQIRVAHSNEHQLYSYCGPEVPWQSKGARVWDAIPTRSRVWGNSRLSS